MMLVLPLEGILPANEGVVMDATPPTQQQQKHSIPTMKQPTNEASHQATKQQPPEHPPATIHYLPPTQHNAQVHREPFIALVHFINIILIWVSGSTVEQHPSIRTSLHHHSITASHAGETHTGASRGTWVLPSSRIPHPLPQHSRTLIDARLSALQHAHIRTQICSGECTAGEAQRKASHERSRLNVWAAEREKGEAGSRIPEAWRNRCERRT